MVSLFVSVDIVKARLFVMGSTVNENSVCDNDNGLLLSLICELVVLSLRLQVHASSN